MKVLSLSLYTFPTETTSTLFSTASDLSAYSFLTKGSVQEGLNFLSSTVASRTLDGQRQSVQEGQNSASVYRKGSVAGESLFDVVTSMTWVKSAGRLVCLGSQRKQWDIIRSLETGCVAHLREAMQPDLTRPCMLGTHGLPDIVTVLLVYYDLKSS